MDMQDMRVKKEVNDYSLPENIRLCKVKAKYKLLNNDDDDDNENIGDDEQQDQEGPEYSIDSEDYHEHARRSGAIAVSTSKRQNFSDCSEYTKTKILKRKILKWCNPKETTYVAFMFQYIIRTVYRHPGHVFTDKELQDRTNLFNNSRPWEKAKKWRIIRSKFISGARTCYGKILTLCPHRNDMYTISKDISKILFRDE